MGHDLGEDVDEGPVEGEGEDGVPGSYDEVAEDLAPGNHAAQGGERAVRDWRRLLRGRGLGDGGLA